MTTETAQRYQVEGILVRENPRWWQRKAVNVIREYTVKDADHAVELARKDGLAPYRCVRRK
jgi:poly(3-hydroxybutyrate) depolymerase